MTTTDVLTQLRDIAEHIETHDLNDTVLSVTDISTLATRNARIQVSGASSAIQNLVRWADTLSNVTVSASTSAQSISVVVKGTIDSGQELDVVAVALGDHAVFVAAHLPVPEYVPVKPAQIDVAALRRLSDARVAEAVA